MIVRWRDDVSGENWLAYGRTYSEQRFSPLDQIHDANVGGLSVDWFVELYTDRGLVSTPLVVDGILYFVGSLNIVRAVDATDGTLLWEYDPEVALRGDRMRAGWEHSRGIGFWDGKVYVATWDGRLNAIDAATGAELWSVMTVEPEKALYITGAPKVFKGKVLIGNGGTEHGPARGYVTAYDAETGESEWRFWIVPGNPADGFENDAMRMAARDVDRRLVAARRGRERLARVHPTTPSWISSTSAPETGLRGTGRSGAPMAATTCS